MKHRVGLAYLSSLALVLGCTQPVASGGFEGEVGLQMYSFREDFKKDVPGTIEKIKALGFKEVELAGTYGMPPEAFKKLIDGAGLVPVAAHFPYNQLRDDIESVAKEAKALGLKYVGCAWAGHKDPLDEKQTLEIAGVFNRAGEALAKHGLRFFYHNHGFEFQPHGDGTLFDLLMKETKPEFVAFEMDILWVQFPGQDPVKLLEKYGSRWELMHLKDLAKGVKTGALTGKTDTRNDVALGTGQVNYPAVLRAAKKAGVKHYFIEDESPIVNEQIPQSLKFMKTVKLD
ncbi:MAG TPA: sugar phosphate isomerase/epimerase [Verrucomicrobiae bacterium]|nr:sugar phosphate isomerase/epimerase [Verrucomicrobiae bacterium]